ncbi:SNF2-related protein [Desulfosporosinus nitroreducens]|uniref:SNF2-related protein n=1 Tax=Desulfosporosinus nitroreducens TaxID=2018668 RepID=A0ABT8QRS8_9FIRM|nr:SNF2-related protein [Desulfosporosinus nitroreducens]MDO0824048.1 SNF2-related protein [Desulfosporosinus nitroreducens]
MAYVTYGTDRANAYKIIEDTLNLRDVRIYDTVTDPDGRERRVLNKKDTTLAQQKQQTIKAAFRDWIWKDPDRRQTLVQQYNEQFNSTRPREYDGSHITFSGINPEITLRPHQLNAIAHILYGGNTLLAHEVGAGKTFEMVGAAMEAKRLGLCQKSLFAVPNHLTEQWASEFLRLYPSANILVASKKDFEKSNRKKFCARIATGDYDAIIMGHSQFERIPISTERQERLLHEQIDEITEGIDELKRNHGERFTIKQLERTRKSLEARLEKLNKTERKDNVVTFEQLGVDRLYVDEAHSFKNLFLYTKMRNVAGLSQTEAQKSSDMFLKCQYIDELTDSKGIIFATGTPVSNSMTELYTMMRYLQYSTLQRQGLSHFDCWASTFGETVTAIELTPEGTGYRARTRFAKFFNLPELMTLFKEVADIKTTDQLKLPIPKANYHTVVLKPTEHQKDMVQELSERAAAVHGGSVDPRTDNMLKITGDGRKLGLDQRIINPLLPDDPDSKVNACVNNILRIWQGGQADRLTQLVFCDISTPKNDGQFNVYEDIRAKLIAGGVPEKEITFIHDANTEVRKKELFAKVRSGQVRILMGSTSKMGAGTNVQDRLIALHDLDCPWRPGDLAQRGGRIVRQGNENPEVDIYRYVTEGTFDSYLYQTVENKQRFISQIMTSKSPVRSCEDVDETALSYAEIKALCAGNPKIKEKMDLDIEVARLRLLKADHQSQQYRMEDKLLKYFPENIERNKGYIKGFEDDMALLAVNAPDKADAFPVMEIHEKKFTEKGEAGAALLLACKEIKDREPVVIGSYRGFAMYLSVVEREYKLSLKGAMTHNVELGIDAYGNLTRIDNALAEMGSRLKSVQAQLDNLYLQMENAKQELGKPFLQEQELQQKSARLAELNLEINEDVNQIQKEQNNENEWEQEL